jgi:hypothetical protein
MNIRRTTIAVAATAVLALSGTAGPASAAPNRTAGIDATAPIEVVADPGPGTGVAEAVWWCQSRAADGSCLEYSCIADARSDCSYFWWLCRQSGWHASGHTGLATCRMVL